MRCASPRCTGSATTLSSSMPSISRVDMTPQLSRAAGRPPLRHRLRSGAAGGAGAAARHRLSLSHLQRRRLRGGAMRQRRPLLRPLRPRPGPDTKDEIPVGTAAGADSAAHPSGRAGQRRHGSAAVGTGRDPVSGGAARRVLRAGARWRSRSRSARCRWATRMRCCGSTTSTRRRWQASARASSTTGASRTASTSASCRSSTGHIRLRVWERGAGETLACGTGACAAAVIGRIQGALDEQCA
jgi:hypothetical protein